MNITKVKLSHNFSNKEIESICSILNKEKIEYINKGSSREFKSPAGLKLNYLDVLIFNLSDYPRVIEIIANFIFTNNRRQPDLDGDILANFVIDFTEAGIPLVSRCIVNYPGIIRSDTVERIYSVEL